MASAWTESGIDWNDLSRSSIRDVVRELYIATSERDFWVRHFGSGGYATTDELTPIDYDATQIWRTKGQVGFILNALSNWLTPSSAPTQSGNNTDYAKNGYRGCFIDFESGSNYEYTNYGNDSDFLQDYYIPTMLNGSRYTTLIEEIQLGYQSFGKDELGNLETVLNVDLSFLRAFDTNISFRFTYEMMETVFKVLNHLTFVRRCTWRDGGYSGKPAVVAISNFNTARMSQGGDFAGNSFEQKRNNLYNSVDCNSSISIDYNPLLRITGFSLNFWRMTYGINGGSSHGSFDVNGLDGANFGTDFFDHKSLIYNLDVAYDFFNDISYKTTFSLPTRPLGHTVRDNPITQLIDEQQGNIDIEVDPNGSWVENSFGRVVNGEVPDSVKTAPPSFGNTVDGYFIEQNMPLINFNKEGFLNYYTETP